MKFKAILGTVNFTLKKYSPEILLGVGIVGVVGSTVLACKATLQAEAILDEHAEKKERIDDCVLLRDTSEVDYPVEAEKQDRRVLMFSTAGKFIRLYGPPVTLMAVSISCILGAHRIMKKRNVALMAAYKVLENGQKRTIVDADGTEHEQDGTEHEQDGINLHLSGFARSFAPERPDQMGSWEGSTQWSKVHEYNLDFLNAKADHFNNMLLTKGFVTINDVYSELGFAPTEAGMICGWRYKSDRGDGYISFKPRGYDGGWNHGINGDEILLDFNIDGVIFDQSVARKEMK